LRQHLKNTLENLDSDYQCNLKDKIERHAKKPASNFPQTIATHVVNSRRRWMTITRCGDITLGDGLAQRKQISPRMNSYDADLQSSKWPIELF